MYKRQGNSNLTFINAPTPVTWSTLATSFSTSPVVINNNATANISNTVYNGTVYSYLNNTVGTVYRFVNANTYNPSLDTFWSTYASNAVSGLIVARGN